jgi:hypothetical protein
MSTQSIVVQNPFGDTAKPGDDVGEAVQHAPDVEVLGVVRGGLESQHVLAFGVRLDGQAPEGDLEPGQVVARCLDHGFDRGGTRAGAVRPVFGAEDGAHRGHVQAGAGPVHDAVEQVLHLRAGAEQQVAAVLHLVDRVGVAEPGPALLINVQGEAQTRGIDPPVADLAQAPYSRGLRQGICDLGQARRVGDRGEAVAVLAEGYPRPARLAGHPLMAVEDHLCGKRRMPRHLDRHVTPLRVQEVKRVVVDVLALLLQIGDHPVW